MGTLKKRNHSQAEKPKGKLRRDNAGKLARFAREDGRQPYKGAVYKGGCETESCLVEEEEVGCIPLNNNTQHMCLCTSNGQPLSHDFKCPRSTVPVTPVPIHNIIPPTTSNTSAESRSASQAVSYVPHHETRDASLKPHNNGIPVVEVNGTGFILALAIGGTLFLFILVIIVVFYFRRRIRRVDGKAQPVGQPPIGTKIS